LAVIGLGGLNIPGSVGGRGRQLIDVLRKTPNARIVALCDVDSAVLDHSVRAFKERGESVAAYADLRKVLENKAIDGVVIALPNHWHALATVWACQAGKDVYVEKPMSHDLWEGRQMAAAARRFGRIVQVGTQNRSSALLRQAFDYIHTGPIGAIRSARALVYRPREGLAAMTGPTAPPATVDYDLWCGPSPKGPLNRPHLHYEWHWFWATGNGEMGNNGVHVIDLARWALRADQLPPRVLSIGGRFATRDTAETPNTQIGFFDYKPAPLLCEVRNVRAPNSAQGIGKFRNANRGLIIDCEGGYLAGDSGGAAVFDREGQKIKEFKPDPKGDGLEVLHFSNFLDAVRSRSRSSLAAEALQGHLSAGCCHMANVSHRLGQQSRPEAIQESLRSDSELLDSFERCREYLRDNGVDLGATPAVLGPWLSLEPEGERFKGEFAAQANALCRREYRHPFVVPQIA
jgi:predicted dehydrogenase